jgi:3-phosphoshikimate 1-carboxyvinyltransferase
MGRIRVPGDKSISHRALILGGVALGETNISGLLTGEDVAATAQAMRSLGVEIKETGDGQFKVFGLGVGGLMRPEGPLDMGNSGTAARLLMGLLGTHDLTATMIGDTSLSGRPMGRVLEPVGQFGMAYMAAEGPRLPLTLKGTPTPVPISYELPVASAQVKSAILLAGLNCPGKTSVIEPEPTRDHTEIMLAHLGADIEVERSDGKRIITLSGQKELFGAPIQVPGDPSSAAFLVAAALIVPGSQLVVEEVLINPLRTGFFVTLQEMGADLRFENERTIGGEKVADIVVTAGALRGVDVPQERAPSMIDEYPILAALAGFADGKTRLNGLAELRVKESDRLAAMAAGLQACGVDVEEFPDGLVITGGGAAGSNSSGVKGGAQILTHMDHRIAMSFLVLGLASDEPVRVDDGAMIATSFPGFADLMGALGARIGAAE